MLLSMMMLHIALIHSLVLSLLFDELAVLALELGLVLQELGEVEEDVDEGGENNYDNANGHRDGHGVLEPEVECVVGEVVVEVVLSDADECEVEHGDEACRCGCGCFCGRARGERSSPGRARLALFVACPRRGCRCQLVVVVVVAVRDGFFFYLRFKVCSINSNNITIKWAKEKSKQKKNEHFFGQIWEIKITEFRKFRPKSENPDKIFF
jgi:hypothetical protein